MDLDSLAEDIIKKALQKGCDRAEVFIKGAKSFSAEAKNGKVEALESSRDFGMSLRVIKNQGLGFAFTTDSGGKGCIENLLQDAVNGADWTEKDEYLDVPDARHAPEVKILDETMKKIHEDELIMNALSLEKATLDSDRRIKKVRKAEVSLSAGDTAIFNSKGIHASYESGYISAQVVAIAEDSGDSQMGWDFAISRRAEDIDFSLLSRNASKRATDLLGARKISTVKAPVILDASVAVDFLGIFSASLSAEAVQKNRSFLAGKVGEKIISPLINIVDDGLMPWGIGTKPVDDEGVPISKKTIVSEGTLTGFLHNTYTANKQGVASTGNASRGSFKGLPGIDVTNLSIEPKTGQKAEGRKIIQNGTNNTLITSLSKGMLVLEAMGIHTADRISGDFSIGVSGLWIEKGEVRYPVKEAVITGNILDLLKRVEDVGSDLRFYGKRGSPALLIGDMDISA
jgi:PmbA protein